MRLEDEDPAPARLPSGREPRSPAAKPGWRARSSPSGRKRENKAPECAKSVAADGVCA